MESEGRLAAGEISIRSYEPGDEETIVALWNRCLPADTIGLDRFVARVLLDANFDPAGFLVALHEGRPAGFLLALTRTTPLAGLDDDPDDGWITVFFVDPACRGRGIGRRLLERGRAHIAARGRRRVSVAPYAPNYFWPGVDVDRYPAAVRFLQRQGFAPVEHPVAMDLNLVGFAIPEAAHLRQQALEQQGYRFGPLRDDQIVSLLAFLAQHFSADWTRAVRDALLRGVPRERVLVAAREQEIAGFCLYGGYDEVAERFGPFGVAPDLRGLGLGAVLLYRCLEQMRGVGLHTAWFLWTGEDDPAGRLYARAGFQVTRRFVVMSAATQ